MSIAAFILCRKNSKRLPNKNTKELCGKALICWTIDSAIESRVIDTLVVGTDDVGVIDICFEKYGFRKRYKNRIIIDLPNYLTTDNAPQTEALLYCMDQIRKHDYGIILQATSPLRNKNDIKNFINGDYDFSASYCSKYDDKSNGAMYKFKWDGFYYSRKLTFLKPFYMENGKGIDIDTLGDFILAEKILKG